MTNQGDFFGTFLWSSVRCVAEVKRSDIESRS